MRQVELRLRVPIGKHARRAELYKKDIRGFLMPASRRTRKTKVASHASHEDWNAQTLAETTIAAR